MIKEWRNFALSWWLIQVYNLKYPPFDGKAFDLLRNESETLSLSSHPIALQYARKKGVLEVITFIYKQAYKLRNNDCHHLGCDVMWFGKNILTFQRIPLLWTVVYMMAGTQRCCKSEYLSNLHGVSSKNSFSKLARGIHKFLARNSLWLAGSLSRVLYPGFWLFKNTKFSWQKLMQNSRRLPLTVEFVITFCGNRILRAIKRLQSKAFVGAVEHLLHYLGSSDPYDKQCTCWHIVRCTSLHRVFLKQPSHM